MDNTIERDEAKEAKAQVQLTIADLSEGRE